MERKFPVRKFRKVGFPRKVVLREMLLHGPSPLEIFRKFILECLVESKLARSGKMESQKRQFGGAQAWRKVASL